MQSIDYANKEISAKIVYYGPGMCGKTTNLEIIYRDVPGEDKTDMVSLATESDRTLFFDFLPVTLGEVKGFKVKFQLYTVPGQVYYNATRKLVLQAVDGVVFVADSQREKLQENIDMMENLRENLDEYGIVLDSLPLVFQWNKRDMDDVVSVEELGKALNPRGVPTVEAVAVDGKGVTETLKAIAKETLLKMRERMGQGSKKPAGGDAAAAAPKPEPKP